MPSILGKLNAHIAELADLTKIASLLYWDHQTYMPPNGSQSRGFQLSTLNRHIHARLTSDEIGTLLEDLRPTVQQLDPTSDDVRKFTKIVSLYKKVVRIPNEWIGEFSNLTTRANKVWAQAKSERNFELFRPYLEEIVTLRRAYAEFFAPYDHIYDPLLDDYEPGMKTIQVKEAFDWLRPRQTELVKIISNRPQVDDSFLHREFDPQKQWDFGMEIIANLGFDKANGRQDRSPHPFTSKIGTGDVRITTRIDTGFLNPALFATLHECGHGLHSLGLDPTLERTVFGARLGPGSGGASMALNESQSRLIENLVGRSYNFWLHYYPHLQRYFPDQLAGVSLDNFYKGINRVQPSLIRVEADESTYNLHIMLRMELEIRLLEGSLEVKDLPTAWNGLMDEYLGLQPPNDAQGVLQDIHWSAGSFGYFPTYALGNVVAGQLWEILNQDIPHLQDHLRRGEFAELIAWLRERVHRHGTKYSAQERLLELTGSTINPEPYLCYLTEKFGAIYGFN
jgi:carboxypeptidase Taq